MRTLILAILFSATAHLSAAEKVFDFNLLKTGSVPPGWKQSVLGAGGPAQWEIVKDTIPSQFEPLTSTAPNTSLRPVIAQLSTDKDDERFPLLYYDEEVYGDFVLTTKLKMVGGDVEQMAGIAFRILDENNYHVVRLSAKGDSLMFYSFLDGKRQPPVGRPVNIESNQWYTLEIRAKNHEFRFRLNGQELIPPLDNPNFRKGKIGYWTKSDSISHFVDTRIDYTPLVSNAQRLVESTMKRYERLEGLRIVLPGEQANSTRILASSDESEIDEPGIKEERLVIDNGEIMYLKTKSDVTVTLPLRDRNGEPIAAIRVTMDTFRGQTQKNAIARAQPVVSLIQSSVMDYQDLFE